MTDHRTIVCRVKLHAKSWRVHASCCKVLSINTIRCMQMRGGTVPQVGPIRLSKEDHSKLADFVRKDGRTQADILREAVMRYVDGYNSVQEDERLKDRDRVIADALKAIENRFAILLVRLGIDLESIYALAWALTSEQPDRTEMFEKCYEVGVNRFRRKMKDQERDLVDRLRHQGDLLKPKSRALADLTEDEEA